MIIIGELINGMYKAVGRAIEGRDASVIQRLAGDQIRNGAAFLDVNTGPYSRDPVEDIKWIVESIRKVCDAPLSLDSTKPEAIEAGLKIAGKRSIINSTSADPEKMDIVFGLAKRYDAQVIGLTMDKRGVPDNKEKRLELAATIMAKAIDSGMPSDDIYLDPIVLPINVAQAQCGEILEAIKEFRHLADPAPNTLIGLSNVSQGTRSRRIMNRTFLVMAMANGLTSAILDPLDKELMDAMITAECVLNKQIYCDSFLEAYRKKFS